MSSAARTAGWLAWCGVGGTVAAFAVDLLGTRDIPSSEHGLVLVGRLLCCAVGLGWAAGTVLLARPAGRRRGRGGETAGSNAATTPVCAAQAATTSTLYPSTLYPSTLYPSTLDPAAPGAQRPQAGLSAPGAPVATVELRLLAGAASLLDGGSELGADAATCALLGTLAVLARQVTTAEIVRAIAAELEAAGTSGKSGLEGTARQATRLLGAGAVVAEGDTWRLAVPLRCDALCLIADWRAARTSAAAGDVATEIELLRRAFDEIRAPPGCGVQVPDRGGWLGTLGALPGILTAVHDAGVRLVTLGLCLGDLALAADALRRARVVLPEDGELRRLEELVEELGEKPGSAPKQEL